MSEIDQFATERNALGWRYILKQPKVLGVTAFASIGGMLYGYNQGVFSQVQVMAEFYHRYQSTLDLQGSAATKGLVTSILELGAVVGALISGVLADKYSRKRTISGLTVFFIVGTIIQASAGKSVASIYVGRFVGGVGIGGTSMLIPMFNAELAPPGIRGSLVGLQQLAITFGICIAYWIAYGTNYIGGTTYPGQSSAAWRVPLAIQIIPGLVLAIGILYVPFSPRWLMLKGREDECLATLASLRGKWPSHPQVQFEFGTLRLERIAEGEIARERYGSDEVNLMVGLKEYKRLFTHKALLRRLAIGMGVQAFQQWSGINAIFYYAPTIFKEIGITGNTTSLLATGVVGIINFGLTVPVVIFIDNFARKPLLVIGGINMAICHAVIAAVLAVDGNNLGQHRPAAHAAIFMVFWFVANEAYSWGPLAWIVSSEVFPLDMRARGMSLSTAANWLSNFAVGMVTPVMIANIGYKTYIVFMCFCICSVIFTILVVPELRGTSLEQLDSVFKDTSAVSDRRRRERVATDIGLDRIVVEVQHLEDGAEQKDPAELA